MRITHALLPCVVLLPALGCAASRLGMPSATDNLVRGNTVFAVDLYRQLAVAEGNLFLSPYSISTALAMTYGGARGKTAQEMADALHFPLRPDELHPAFAAVAARLHEVQQAGHVRLSTANSLWPQKDYPLQTDYLALVKQHYGSTVTAVDYRQAAEKARLAINAWVEAQTQDKIRGLIQPGVLDALTRLVLVNAIYFKGAWEVPFKPGNTRDAPFHVAADRTVQAPLMTQKQTCRYASLAALDLVELPYAGGDLAMVVLLPKTREGLKQLEAALTADVLDGWLDQLADQEVLVSLPRFKLTSLFQLNETLQALGMVDAFAPGRADFSGLAGKAGELFISAAIHKAFVEVNEEGTEAAAATAVAIAMTSVRPPPPVFRADHPFLFLIRERRAGSILFIGRLQNPSAGA